MNKELGSEKEATVIDEKIFFPVGLIKQWNWVPKETEKFLSFVFRTQLDRALRNPS